MGNDVICSGGGSRPHKAAERDQVNHGPLCSLLLFTPLNEDLLAHSEMLPLFSEEAAILFLLRRAEHIARDASVSEASADEVGLATKLCHLLDRLPLALDQAGAYIAENGCSLQRYMDLYENYHSKLLARCGEATGHPSVFLTFKLSWEQLQKHHELAAQALTFCTFLAPDQIPEQMVMDALLSLQSDSPPDALALDEALGWRHRYSLIERRDQMVSLHRLVQEVMQEVLVRQEQEQWMQRTVQVVNAAFPNGKYGTWTACELLLAQAFACAWWMDVLTQPPLEGARLLNKAGSYLSERGQYQEAEALHQQALAIAEEQVGASHPDIALSLNNLTLLYWHQGRYSEAEALYQRALAITEEQLGASHPDTATSLNNLALFYREQGRYGEASPLLKRAVMICQASLGTEHPRTQQFMRNYKILLTYLYPNRDVEMMLQRLAQPE